MVSALNGTPRTNQPRHRTVNAEQQGQGSLSGHLPALPRRLHAEAVNGPILRGYVPPSGAPRNRGNAAAARIPDAINAKERTESHPGDNVTVRNRFPGLSPEQFEATRRDFAARYPDLTSEQIVEAIAAILLPGSTLNCRQIDDIVCRRDRCFFAASRRWTRRHMRILPAIHGASQISY